MGRGKAAKERIGKERGAEKAMGCWERMEKEGKGNGEEKGSHEGISPSLSGGFVRVTFVRGTSVRGGFCQRGNVLPFNFRRSILYLVYYTVYFLYFCFCVRSRLMTACNE